MSRQLMKFLERNNVLLKMIMINSVLLFLAGSIDNSVNTSYQILFGGFYMVSVSIVFILIGFRQIMKYIRAVGMVVLSEVLSAFYIMLCNQKYGVYSPSISMIQLFNLVFQMTFCKDGWSYCFITVKHLIVNFWWNNTGGLLCYALYQLIPFMFIASFIRSLQGRTALIDMYKLRMKNLSQNFNQMSCGIAEGMLILSTNNQIIFASSVMQEHIGCESGDIQKILSNSFYITSKSASTPLKKPFSLYEDIKYCIESNTQYKKLGRTLHNSKVLEWIYKRIEWNNQESVLLLTNEITDFHDMECRFKDCTFKSSLLKIVSHELRTPCNSIIFFSEKCMESTDNSSPLYEYLTIAKNSSTYMLLLINDLLDYTKILSGNFRINKQEFCPSELLKECMGMFEYQARKKNLNIYLTIDPTMPIVAYSDALRVKQILLNLLSNAVK